MTNEELAVTTYWILFSFAILFFFISPLSLCYLYRRESDSENGDAPIFDRAHLLSIMNDTRTNLSQHDVEARHNLIKDSVIKKRVISDRKGIDRRKESSSRSMSSKSNSQKLLTAEKESVDEIVNEECCSCGTENSSGDEDNGEYKGDMRISEQGSFRSLIRENIMRGLSHKSFTSIGNKSTSGNEADVEYKGDIRISEQGSFRRLIRDNIMSGKSFTSIASTESVYKQDTCFICLERYKVNESIYWSTNEKCKHSFHSSCITRWLLKHNDCPLCREDFLNAGVEV